LTSTVSSSTSNTPAISSLGIGSGLDLNTLLDNLQQGEDVALTAISDQQDSYNTKLSSYGQLKSALSNFQSAAAAVGTSSLYGTVTAVVSNNATLSASADSTAVAGNYSINVTQLAQAQSLVSAGQASSSAVIGGGTITLQLGTTSGSTFTAGSSAAVQIQVGDSSSLLDIRDAINKANAGVTASVINDGSGTPYRLALTSNATGAASTMRISVADDAGSSLSSVLDYDPAGTKSMTQTMAGENADLSINGIDVTSASNTVTGAAQGVTLNLATVGSTSLAVKSDTTTITNAIQNFVNTYNTLQSTVSSLTAYDTSTNTGSPLTGDNTTLTIQNELEAALNNAQKSTGANGLSMLTQVGVSFQTDGTLALDTTKLGTELSTNLTGVQQLFAGTDGLSGFGNQISNLLTNVTGADGSLTDATDGINQTLTTLNNEYTEEQDRIDTDMANYRTQFTNLDMYVSQMNSTASYLTQQFSAMNGSSSSSSSSKTG
jgi:flagellar hook-associated protein 2